MTVVGVHWNHALGSLGGQGSNAHGPGLLVHAFRAACLPLGAYMMFAFRGFGGLGAFGDFKTVWAQASGLYAQMFL